MKTKRGKSPAANAKIVKSQSRKLSPKVAILQSVFEGTIGGRKYLLDASAKELKVLADITGQSPKDYADSHQMRIVNRAQAHPDAVRTLKKSWNVAKATEYEMAKAQAKLKREAAKEVHKTHKIATIRKH